MKLKFNNFLPLLLISCATYLNAQVETIPADTFFGHIVKDPYRWMENLKSPRLVQWLNKQEVLKEKERKQLGSRLMVAKRDIRWSAGWYIPLTSNSKINGWYFYTARDGYRSDGRAMLYYTRDPEKQGEVLFDPGYETDNYYELSDWSVSPDGKFIVVVLSLNGSDWEEIRIIDFEKRKPISDKIKWAKFSHPQWHGNGFFYSRFDKPRDGFGQNEGLTGQRLYYHTINTKQEDDVLVFSTPTYFHFSCVGNGHFLVLTTIQKIQGQPQKVVEYKDLTKGLFAEWKLLINTPAKDDYTFELIGLFNGRLFFRTNYGAPNYRILAYNPDSTGQLTEVIAQYDKVLHHVDCVHHEIVATYFTGGHYQVYMFDFDGKLKSGINFDPGIQVSRFYGSATDTDAIYYENTFYLPRVVYRYNFNTRKSTLVNKTIVAVGTEPGKYITEVVNYKSHDGTVIPMYLTHKKNLKVHNNNPVILYGYGGFGYSITPFYDYSNLTFFDNNGILAVPMIRGGGEYGDNWHIAGCGLNKQNSFDDFIAAAEFLKAEGYTTKERLAIEGSSSGGLLVAAVMLQQPDLCQVVVAKAGVYDMIRYPKFTMGEVWTREYGTPDDSISFCNLLKYSPLHNVKPDINYPAALFIAGQFDDRVPPFNTYKLLATIQKAVNTDTPHILYYEAEAAHSLQDQEEERAFTLAFIFKQMSLPLKWF